MPLISFLLFVFVTSFTPGPNNIMAMLIANKYGIQKTIKFCLGVGAGVFIIIILSSYLNIVLGGLIPKIQFTMKILGTAYMLYLATKILMSKPNQDDQSAMDSSFFTGILLQLINPKGLLYCLTVVSTFILPYYSSQFILIGFSLFLALVGFTSTICWSLFGTLFNKFLSEHRRAFNVVMALLLMYSVLAIHIE